jgi:hypothetical protein
VLLLKHIMDSVYELGVFAIPELCLVVGAGNLNPDQLLAVSSLVVVNHNQELLGISPGAYWTVDDCIVLYPCACQDVLGLSRDSVASLKPVLYLCLVRSTAEVKILLKLARVVVAHILFVCSGDRVVVLINSERVQHFVVDV